MAGKGAMSATDAIRKFKEKLNILPMEDAIFVAKLDAAGFFTMNHKDMMSTEKTNADKATYFLDKVVGVDADHYVPMLLTKMVELEGPYERFATDIQRKMSGSSGGSSGGASGSGASGSGASGSGASGSGTSGGSSSGIVEEKYEQDEDGEPLYDEKYLQKKYEDAKFQTTELKKFENLEMEEKKMVTKVQAMIVVVNDFEDLAIKCHLKPPDDSDVILDVLCTKSDGPDLSKKSFLIGQFGKCPVAVTRVAQGCGRDAAVHAGRDVFPNMQVFIALGVAAGFAKNKVRLGDVLISERIHDCSIVKLKEGEIIPRGKVSDVHGPILNFLKNNHDWKFPCTKDKMRHSSAIVGPILSKPELLDDPKKREQYIQAHCKEAKGFEMEGFGLMGYEKIGCIIVKGVCDYAGKKAKKWQPTAALAANDCLLKVLMKNDLSAFLNDQA